MQRKYTIDVLDDAGREVKRVYSAQPAAGESPVSAELAAVLDAAWRPTPADVVVVAPPPPAPPPRPAGIHVPSGENWAEAVYSAKPGDTVWLESGGIYTHKLASRQLREVTIATYFAAGEKFPATICVQAGTAIELRRAANVEIREVRVTAKETTAQGVRLLGCQGVILNRVESTNFTFGVTSEPDTGMRPNHLTLLNCHVHDNYSPTANDSSGVFMQGTDVIGIVGGVFDHNGWREGFGAGASRQRNHNLYIAGDCTGLEVTDARISRGCSHGLQARCGGRILRNQFVDNPIHLSLGLLNGGGPITPGGVLGVVKRNLFAGERRLGSNVGATEPRGWAIEVGNLLDGEILDNVFASDAPPNTMTVQAAIKLDVCRLEGPPGKDGKPTPHPQEGKQIRVIRRLVITGNKGTWPSNPPGTGPVWAGAKCDDLVKQQDWPAVDVAAERVRVG